MKDKSGTEITMGARVEHRYEAYSGIGEVVGFTEYCVKVERLYKKQTTIRIHCPALLLVVE